MRGFRRAAMGVRVGIDRCSAEEGMGVASGVRSCGTPHVGWAADVVWAREGLKDDHRRAAVAAHEGGSDGSVRGLRGLCVGLNVGSRLLQQLACRGDVLRAAGIGE